MVKSFPPGLEVMTLMGGHMTAIRVDDEVVIFDMGVDMPNYIEFTEDADDLTRHSVRALREAGAIPDDTVINHWRKNVKAILIGHGHMDHIGSVPFLAKRYDCPIVASPYSCAVMKAILKDEKVNLPNKFKPITANNSFKVSKNLTAEFVHMTHSTPQSSAIVLHTKYGAIVYAIDFKLDNNPTMGKPPNYKRLKQIGDKGVILAVVDSLYITQPGKMASEAVAKDMVRDAMLGVSNEGKAIVITTFSSHVARLKSIVEFAQKTGRKVVFLGRSLVKYSQAAQSIGLVDFKQMGVELVKYGGQVKRKFNMITRKGKDDFVLVVTGNQGEPKSMLSKMSNNMFNFKFHSGDHVLFSSKVIPVEPNKTYRRELDSKLRAQGVRLYTDLHVSGHAAREDIREFLMMLKPTNVIPSHWEKDRVASFKTLWAELEQPKETFRVPKPGKSEILV
jgi:ribonuclease J